MQKGHRQMPVVKVRIPEPMIERLRSAVKEDGRSTSEYIRSAIDRAMRDQKPK